MNKIIKTLALFLCVAVCLCFLPIKAVAEMVEAVDALQTVEEASTEEVDAEEVIVASEDSVNTDLDVAIVDSGESQESEPTEAPVTEESAAEETADPQITVDDERNLEEVAVAEQIDQTPGEDTETANSEIEIIPEAEQNEAETEPVLTHEEDESAALMAEDLRASGTWGGNLQWKLNNSGVLTISGSGEMEYDGSGSGTAYPWYPYRESVQRIVIERGVTSIASSAFVFSNATRVELPEGLKTISNDAFFRNYKLNNIEFPSTLETIGWQVFVGTQIPHFHIPASVRNIGGIAFLTWRNDTRITVDPSNPVFHTDEDGALYEGDWRLIWCPGKVAGDYEISETVEEVESYAFSACSRLTSIIFPESVRSIGAFMFNSSGSLKTIQFNGAPPDISSNSFYRVNATAYYQYGYGWSQSDFQNYEGTLQWEPLSISLNKTTLDLGVDRSETLKATRSNGSLIPAIWSSSDEAVATVNQNGVVTAHRLGTATITAEIKDVWIASSCEVQTRFNDVMDPGKYFYQPVYWAVDNGITSGTSAATFSPYNTCTRGQVMAFLYKASGSPEVSGENPFTDVKESDYFYKPVLWAVSQGITNGTTATTFSPYNTCTRAQVMAFLYKANGSPAVSGSNPFTDVKESDYFYNAVLWAVANGITSGTSATTFAPYNTCTRAQVMTFLYKAMN